MSVTHSATHSRATSPVSTIEAYDEQAAKTARHALGENTRSAYDSKVEQFRQFCEKWETDMNVITADTPRLIRNFIVQKCEVEKLGVSTAEQIRAALKKYYKVKLYRGENNWQIDVNDPNKVQGNPVDDPNLTEYFKGLKNIKAKNYVRNHSSAISFQDMVLLHEYVEGGHERHSMTEVLFMAAFATCNFYCMFRYVIEERNKYIYHCIC